MRGVRTALLWLLTLLAIGPCVAAGEPEFHKPIAILGDADFTAENGVRGGSGTLADPYVISGWSINARQGDFCIRIQNVTQVFRIADCSLTGSRRYAIELIRVERAEVLDSCLSGSTFGLLWKESSRCVIRNCTFDTIEWEAISVLESSACEVANCLFKACGPAIWVSFDSMSNEFIGNVFVPPCRIGIRLEAGSGGNLIAQNDFHGIWCHCNSYNLWTDTDGNGNYWSRYRGSDRDGDGIGDTSFEIFGDAWQVDNRPAMAPFHPEADAEWDRCH